MDWGTWLTALGVGELKPAGALHFSQYEQMIQAAVSGAQLIQLDEAEFVLAGKRLDDLDTGLRAQRRLREGLRELAAGTEAWHRAISSNRLADIRSAKTAMRRHLIESERIGKLGLADLERGI